MDRTKNLRPFKPGQSGNPSGRPKVPEEVKEAARALTMEAIDTLGAIMRDTGASAPARVSAATEILNRAWGKPEQHVTLDAKREVAEFIASVGMGAAEALAEEGIPEPDAVRH